MKRLLIGALLLSAPAYSDGMKSGAGDTLPATCAAGDIFSITTPPRGVYDCVATNTWRAQGFGISCTAEEYVMGDGSCQTNGGGGGPTDWADILNKPSTFQPPLPTASAIGGVRSLTCSGSDKISALGSDGIPVCSADQSGGALSWGAITGTLSSQTDLQSALNGKEASGTFSGVGACGSNQWASTLNDGAAPTCTQPGFSSLSGAATDAQVPNNITVDLATTATTANAGDSATSFFPSGTVEVNRGGTGAAPGADDQVLISDSTSAATWRAVNDCQGAGKALTYTASSNTWGCNTISGGGGGGPLIARKTADQQSTSATFADVTGLTFSISANTAYSLTCELSYLSAAATTALQVSLNGPSSPTAVRFTVQTATSATASHFASQNTYDANTNPANALTTALPVRVTGTVENGANAGTLALRMRTEIAASGVTIQRGSWCALY